MAEWQGVIPISTPTAPPHNQDLTTSPNISTNPSPHYRDTSIGSISREDSPPPPPYSQVCPETGLPQQENLSHPTPLAVLFRYSCLGTLLAYLTCLTLGLILLYVQLASLQEEAVRLDIRAVEGVRKELKTVVDQLEYNTSSIVQGLREQVDMLNIRLDRIEGALADNLSSRAYFIASKAGESSPSSLNNITWFLCAAILLSQNLM